MDGADNVQGFIIPGSGHRVADEARGGVPAALKPFLAPVP